MIDRFDTSYLRGRTLTLYLLESGSEIRAVTGDADWAAWQALEAAAETEEPVTVRRVTFRQEYSEVVFPPTPVDEDEGDEEADVAPH